MMKILVTGGAGFIGSHICKKLLDSSHQVIVYDNLSRGHLDSLDKRCLFIQGELDERSLLVKTLTGVDAVVHMASLIEVGESVKYPEQFIKNNILGSFNLLEGMREAGVKRIIFSSTASVYAYDSTPPLTEETKVQAANPYGATKIAVENLLSSYNFNWGVEATILRYFNAYGPGEKHDPETHAIPNFIKAALSDKPIPLYWQGKQIRDFIYIDDLAEAHTLVLGLEGFNVFNVGTERGVVLSDVIRNIEDILGKKLKIEDLGERKGDVVATFASSQKLRSTTGWSPKTNLKQGLEETIKWYQSNRLS